MKTTRIASLMKKRLRRRAPRTTPSHRPRHQFIASSDFTLADRRSATGTKIIENLAVRQDQKQPLSHRHRGFAFLAIEARGSEIFKLLLAHAEHPRRSYWRGYQTTLSRATASRQPP